VRSWKPFFRRPGFISVSPHDAFARRQSRISADVGDRRIKAPCNPLSSCTCHRWLYLPILRPVLLVLPITDEQAGRTEPTRSRCALQHNLDLQQQLHEREEYLAAARAANRELMARLNTPTRLRWEPRVACTTPVATESRYAASQPLTSDTLLGDKAFRVTNGD
jgi:hypothetical protein